MKIIKKIKRFLGLELPYLLEDEDIKDPIVFKNKKENIVNNTESKINKNAELENQLRQFNNCMINSSISMNEARELLNLEKIGKEI